MMIQIHGAGFHNLGAWLMLETVMSELRNRLPESLPEWEAVEFCATPNSFTTYEKSASYKLRTVLPRPGPRNFLKASAVALLDKAIARRWSAILGIVPGADIDALIDISGSAFGDAWGVQQSRNCKREFRYFHDRGKPVIMLPQMMGPFEDTEVKDETQKMLRSVERLYVRDSDSLAAVGRIAEKPEKLSLAPDITIFAGPEATEERPPFGCIVPNERILDMGAGQWGERYYDLLGLAIRKLLDLDRDVVLLSHSPGDRDLEIVQRLAKEAGSSRVEIVAHVTPRVAKGIISRADLLISSRFHALVAALSTRVPAIAIGWSHKYPALLSDFDVPGFNFEPSQSDRELLDLMDQCLEQAQEIGERLAAAKQKMSTVNESMWREVTQTLGSWHKG